MTWLWASYEELKKYVHPVMVKGRGIFLASQTATWFENQKQLHDAVRDLSQALEELHKLGFSGDYTEALENHGILEGAKHSVLKAVFAGEVLLVYHKRLALSMAAYGFLHQHAIVEHWNGSRGSRRTALEIHQFRKDAMELLAGYYALAEQDNTFLKLDLPEGLASDFKLARDLFSVGFDDVGLLIAGRGLEGVLRKVADVRKLNLVSNKGKPTPGSEVDFHDLIEMMYRVRWKTRQQRLISSETKALLHYLRVLRNGGAHANIAGRNSTVGPRETAIILVETANRLWNEVHSSRARLEPKDVVREW
jgi:hypothetical protein